MSTYKYKFYKTSFPCVDVLLVEINRPPVNAFNHALFLEMRNLFEQADRDCNVRAIVFTSTSPKIFSAGIDFYGDGLDKLIRSGKENAVGKGNAIEQEHDPARRAWRIRQHIMFSQTCINTIASCCKPVIAAMHGSVIGAGVDIACACDIRYASANTSFSIKEARLGLAADLGTLQRFPKIVGNESWTRELALTSRSFDAFEAYEHGFLSKVVIPGTLEDVTKASILLAAEIAKNSPVSVVSTKHLLNHAQGSSVNEGLEYTAAWNSGFIQTDDIAKSIPTMRGNKHPSYAKL